MADNETIADIIAEMRGIRVREFQDYADRFEWAHKRERGDCAKLREALEEVLDDYQDDCAISRMIRAALAAPPRNCDVGVPEERIQRWSKFCKARSKKLPPIHGFEWEDYPYESEVKEGGDDGNK